MTAETWELIANMTTDPSGDWVQPDVSKCLQHGRGGSVPLDPTSDCMFGVLWLRYFAYVQRDFADLTGTLDRVAPLVAATGRGRANLATMIVEGRYEAREPERTTMLRYADRLRTTDDPFKDLTAPVADEAGPIAPPWPTPGREKRTNRYPCPQ